jgi:hypothetical protein
MFDKAMADEKGSGEIGNLNFSAGKQQVCSLRIACDPAGILINFGCGTMHSF